MNTKFNLFDNLNLSFNFNISIWTGSTVALGGLLFYYFTHPEKFEKMLSLIAKILNFITKKFDKTYIKYDLQGKINDYLKIVSKKVKHIDIEKINISWIDIENQTPENYVKNGQLILRLHKSNNQNQNIVNASMAFISSTFLKKAKSYIAKYQRESIDLYVCYDLLKNEKSEILDQFVQDFMREKMDNDKVAELFKKYIDIDKAGIFYPILVQELTFLGEKVFAHGRDPNQIYEEVKHLVIYLNNYANRKSQEDTISDFNGLYCKFAIRIIGKQFKVVKNGEGIYIYNLEKINSVNETIYLTGNIENRPFIKSVFDKCKDRINYSVLTEDSYSAVIKDADGNDYKVNSYLMILRNNKITVFHK
jgi:hypothetical protein